MSVAAVSNFQWLWELNDGMVFPVSSSCLKPS